MQSRFKFIFQHWSVGGPPGEKVVSDHLKGAWQPVYTAAVYTVLQSSCVYRASVNYSLFLSNV